VSQTLDTLGPLVDAVCATTDVAELKNLHRKLEALDLLEAADEPGALEVLDRVFARLDARVEKLDPASEASRVVQDIRDTVTSS